MRPQDPLACSWAPSINGIEVSPFSPRHDSPKMGFLHIPAGFAEGKRVGIFLKRSQLHLRVCRDSSSLFKNPKETRNVYPVRGGLGPA